MITATNSMTENNVNTQYILEQLSYSTDDQLLFYIWGPVAQGDSIQTTKESLFDIPCEGYVMYIDLYPTANLFHPVQYVFLASQTQRLTVFDAKSPPLNFDEYSIVKTPFSQFFYSLENRRAPIPSTTTPASSTTGRDSRWAVLMNGGYDSGNNHVRYWNDLSNIYITLNSVYEFPDENIIVLCSDGLSPTPDQSNGLNSDPDLDGDGDDDIMYSCVLSNVDAVFEGLAENFTGTEKLFVFTTDHGDTAGGQNSIENLWNHEELTDAHFAELLEVIPASEIICTLEPCFSGGFLDNIVVPPGPIVASSACRYDEYSWAMPPDYVYDTYVFHWTAAVNGEDAYGNPVDADANQDGLITMDEAYIYAVAHDTDDESPQYGEYPEGTGSSVSLWVGSNPPSQPTKPVGPTLAVWHREYTYSSMATEPDDEQIFYQFNWGDGNSSGWVGPYNSGQTGSASHAWTELGTYNITVRARDINGAGSPLSEALTVVVTDNTPPFDPTITGPSEIKPKTAITFNVSSIDEFDHDVSFDIDWGDGNGVSGLGPYLSGEIVQLTHTWAKRGTYKIKVKATDQFGMESNWTYLEVVCPTEFKIPVSTFLQRLFEMFPNAFPILRYIFGYS
jgi:hypothetical protein